MKYERLTERDKNGVAIYKQKCNADDMFENLCIQAQREEAVLNRLAELEDKLERGELVENTVVTYVNMGRCNSKTLIDKALKYDELKTKLENGTLIEVDNTLIGQCVIGIHKYTNGTYSLNLDENLVIGFADNGIVTWNNTHGFNDWFSNDLCFIDNEQGRAEAEKKLKELKGE